MPFKYIHQWALTWGIECIQIIMNVEWTSWLNIILQRAFPLGGNSRWASHVCCYNAHSITLHLVCFHKTSLVLSSSILHGSSFGREYFLCVATQQTKAHWRWSSYIALSLELLSTHAETIDRNSNSNNAMIINRLVFFTAVISSCIAISETAGKAMNVMKMTLCVDSELHLEL